MKMTGSSRNVLLLCTAILGISGCQGQKIIENSDYVIEYLSMWDQSEPQAEALQYLASEFFNRLGMQVSFVFAGREALIELKKRLVTKDLPDIVEHRISELYAFFLTNGFSELHSMNGLIQWETGPEGQSNVGSIFPSQFLEMYQFSNDYYFLPYSVELQGHFYSKSAFDKYKIDIPSSIIEYLSLGQILKSKKQPTLEYDFYDSTANALYTWFVLNRIAGPDFFRSLVLDRSGASWTSQEVHSAVELVEMIRDSEIIRYQPILSHHSQLEILSKFNLSNDNNLSPLGFYDFPTLESNVTRNSSITIELIGFALLDNGQNHEISKLLLKYLLRKESSVLYAEMVGSISARNDIQINDMSFDLTNPYMLNSNFQLPFDEVHIDFPSWWSAIFLPLNDKLLQGKITSDTFVSLMARRSMEFWERN